jgi:hypothetical protein
MGIRNVEVVQRNLLRRATPRVRGFRGKSSAMVSVPTPESYSNIPTIFRPILLQRIIPHPSWVDLMVFPSFRNALINDLRDWAGPCMRAHWELLWPRTLEEALIRDDTGRVLLHPEFADLVMDAKNWLMQRTILDESLISREVRSISNLDSKSDRATILSGRNC